MSVQELLVKGAPGGPLHAQLLAQLVPRSDYPHMPCGHSSFSACAMSPCPGPWAFTLGGQGAGGGLRRCPLKSGPYLCPSWLLADLARALGSSLARYLFFPGSSPGPSLVSPVWTGSGRSSGRTAGLHRAARGLRAPLAGRTPGTCLRRRSASPPRIISACVIVVVPPSQGWDMSPLTKPQEKIDRCPQRGVSRNAHPAQNHLEAKLWWWETWLA